MRFLFVAPRFHTNQYFWAKALLDAGHEARYFVLRKIQTEWPDLLSPRVIPRSVFSWGRLFRFRALYKQMKEYDPDIIVVRGVAGYSLQAYLAARWLGKRTLVYDQSPKYSEQKHRRVLLRCLRLLRLVPPVRITPVLGEGEYNDESAVYIPFAADFDLVVTEKTYVPKGKVKIVSVGKLAQTRKNHSLLLNAIKELKEIYSIELEVAGSLFDGESLADLERVIQDKGLSDIVRIHQNLSFKEMRQLYLNSDLFVLPSSNEPAAYSLLEAMNFGLPVICSDTNGTRCYMEEGENGYIFKSDDQSDLTKKIERIIQNRDIIEKMGRRSFELVKQNHGPEKFHRNLMDVVKSL